MLSRRMAASVQVLMILSRCYGKIDEQKGHPCVLTSTQIKAHCSYDSVIVRSVVQALLSAKFIARDYKSPVGYYPLCCISDISLADIADICHGGLVLGEQYAIAELIGKRDDDLLTHFFDWERDMEHRVREVWSSIKLSHFMGDEMVDNKYKLKAIL